jgi:hypothetical protein
MPYETPKMDEVGVASELIQAMYGPYYDGDAYIYSFGLVCSPLEEE